MANAAANIGWAGRVSTLLEEDAAGEVSGRDGGRAALGRVTGAGCAALRKRRDRSQAGGA